MFCDGKCKTKKKTCGLYVTETFQEKVTGKIDTVERCIFMSIFSALIRAERQNDGLHAAMNSTRNEGANQSAELQNILGHGFLALAGEIRKATSIEVSDESKPRLAAK